MSVQAVVDGLLREEARGAGVVLPPQVEADASVAASPMVPLDRQVADEPHLRRLARMPFDAFRDAGREGPFLRRVEQLEGLAHRADRQLPPPEGLARATAPSTGVGVVA